VDVLAANLCREYSDDRDHENDGEGTNPGTGLENPAHDLAARQRDSDEHEQQQLNPGHRNSSAHVSANRVT